MIDNKKVKKIISERKKLHPDDPAVEKKWSELTDLFKKNEKETIKYLENCEGEELEWISEIFEDISEQLQSKKFIDTLELLEKKYPELDLKMNVEFAKKAIN